jgi:hypothetical protein
MRCVVRATGKKKPSDSLTVFRKFRVCFFALPPLSIRQRSEMPEKIKIKLGGHGGGEVVRQKRLSGFITRSGSIDKSPGSKMRIIRTLHAIYAENVRTDCVIPDQTVPPTVIRSIRNVGWPTPTGTLWPSLPHTPTPVSSDMSLPIMLTYFSDSGPLPISVAPFTG